MPQRRWGRPSCVLVFKAVTTDDPWGAVRRCVEDGSGSLAAIPAIGHDDGVITVASHPADLSVWDQEQDPYYLEVFGEAEPVLDMSHAEVLPAGESAAKTTTSTPVCEYWWTVGHGGTKPEHRHLFDTRKKRDLWQRLENIAARVYLYFPIGGGWRVQELAASAKYLAELPTSRTGLGKPPPSGSGCNPSSRVPGRWLPCSEWCRV